MKNGERRHEEITSKDKIIENKIKKRKGKIKYTPERNKMVNVKINMKMERR